MAAEPRDPTFRNYSSEQGAYYAQQRRGYQPRLYEIVIEQHTSTGGQLDTILDVGCGPGIAVRGLAPRFNHAIGLDPSEGMISTARELGDASSSSEPIRFAVSSAEEIGANLSPPILDGSVDLITAATAAHWFDMTQFWPRAAQVLKPGGSVAIWTSSTLKVDPSVPNHTAIQAAVDALEERTRPYMVPGNLLARKLYVGMPLPWSLENPVPEFDEATFVRREWNTGPESEQGDDIFGTQQKVDVKTLEKVLATGSPVTRWREAHPEAVGTEDDVVRILRRDIERALRDAGVDPETALLKGYVAGVLMVVKKKL